MDVPGVNQLALAVRADDHDAEMLRGQNAFEQFQQLLVKLVFGANAVDLRRDSEQSSQIDLGPGAMRVWLWKKETRFIQSQTPEELARPLVNSRRVRLGGVVDEQEHRFAELDAVAVLQRPAVVLVGADVGDAEVRRPT